MPLDDLLSRLQISFVVLGIAPVPKTRRVLNLCFHGIGVPDRRLEPDEERYWLSVDQFEELVAVVAGHSTLRMTFDDGNASDASIALPLLAGRQLTASFFVVAGRLGERGSLSRTDVRELARHDMTVGLHGMRHRAWRGLDDEGVREELVEARRLIAEASGRPVNEASCPFGSYDRRVLEALRQNGFERVYTVDERRARPNAWLQPRYTMTTSATPALLERLAGGSRSDAARETLRLVKSAIKQWR